MKKEEEKKKKIFKIEINFAVLAVILIIILSMAITPRTFQNDTYYTIKIGELINNNGIDMMDHFSWHENLSYTYPHWLYDLLTYFVYASFDFQGVYILTCILSAILGVSVFLVNSKLTKSQPVSFVVTIGVLYMIQSYIAARAQLVTFILFIWTLYFIEKFLENKKLRYAVFLIITATLIANLHVAVWPFFFVLFLPYIAEYFIAILADIIINQEIAVRLMKTKIKYLSKKNKTAENEEKLNKLKEKLEDFQIKLEKVNEKREEEKKNPYKIRIQRNPNVKWLILIMVICAFTGLLTPLGDTPYTYLYKTMQGNTTKNISEHVPIVLADNKDAMGMLIVFLAIFIFTKVKIRLSDLFMLAGLCYLMLSTRRQLSMFVLICSVILTRFIIQLFEIYTKDRLKEVELAVRNIMVAVSLAALMLFISYDSIKSRIDDDFVNTSAYPVAACDYILENIDMAKTRFYNEYNYGSYMLFRGIPVFIDSRADLYTPQFSGKEEDIFSDFIDVSGIAKFYEDVFEKYNITHVITSKKSKMNMIITKTEDKNYKELYSDDNFVVYERLNVKD